MTESHTFDAKYRLSADEFLDAFAKEWSSLTTRFVKVECLQTYDESDDPSYQAFIDGKIDDARALLKDAYESQRQFYLKAQESCVSLIRIRIVQYPISEYLAWELEAYKIAASLGEEILVVDQFDLQRTGVVDRVHDFLLFDTRSLFVHDYDDNGKFRGGHLIPTAKVIDRYEQIVEDLLQLARPLSEAMVNAPD